MYWLDRAEMVDLMKGWWYDCDATGNSGYIIGKKLSFLKEKLKAWAKSNFGKIEAHFRKWEVVVADLEAIKEVFGLSEEEQVKRGEMDTKLNEALMDETRFWTQRAHRQWQLEGDRCSSIFHKIVNIKATKNSIEGLVIDGKL